MDDSKTYCTLYLLEMLVFICKNRIQFFFFYISDFPQDFTSKQVKSISANIYLYICVYVDSKTVYTDKHVQKYIRILESVFKFLKSSAESVLVHAFCVTGKHSFYHLYRICINLFPLHLHVSSPCKEDLSHERQVLKS